jgi:hypothetical protein
VPSIDEAPSGTAIVPIGAISAETGGAISRTRAYELVALNILDARKIGRRTVITRESLNAYLRNLPPALIRRRSAKSASQRGAA